jgi:hypothetical protein
MLDMTFIAILIGTVVVSAASPCYGTDSRRDEKNW